tara:strand:+ start:542 stop:931 length:390 start_codon:yes stop_codon:yes gene_type:complete
MKGQLKRFRERQQQTIKRSYANAVSIYEQTLQQVVAAAPGRQRQDDRDLVLKMRPGVIYAMRCPDDGSYYRTVYLKTNPLTGDLQTLLSNPVAGTTPPGMEEVSPEQVVKQQRDRNFTNLNAFPFRGQS